MTDHQHPTPQPQYGQYAHSAPYSHGGQQPPPGQSPGGGPAFQPGIQPGWYGPAPRYSSVRPSAEYQELTRGPRWAWWRPLASFGLLLPTLLMAFVVMGIATFVPLAMYPDQMEIFDPAGGGGEIPVMRPETFLGMNIGLAVLIPVAVCCIALAFWLRPGYVHSVAGRFRWGWTLRCLAVLTPWWLAFLVGANLLSGEGFALDLHPHVWWMLAIVLLTTPLQAAGEEYLFRAFVLQWWGSWIPWRWLALALATLTSTALFALAHGSMDVWVLADLGLFAAVAVFLTVRTGGLEAAVAMHTVNNVVLMVMALVFGGFEDSFVSTDTTSTPWALLVTVLLQGVGLLLVEWQWRRAGHARRTAPADVPASTPGQDAGALLAGSR